MTQSDNTEAAKQSELSETQTITKPCGVANWEAHAAEFAARIDDTLPELLELIDTWYLLEVGRLELMGEAAPEPNRYKELKYSIQSFLDASSRSSQ